MKISRIIIGLFPLFILSSCVDVVDVKVPKGEELLVIEGLITNQPGPYIVKLTRTAPYFNQAPNPKVSGAMVVIKDNEGVVDTLKEAEPGRYLTSHIQGKIGNKYTLYLNVEEEEYQATSEIKRVPPIDSILFQYAKADATQNLPEGYFARYFGPETEGVGDYYRFKVYKNDTLINAPSDLAISNDEFVDGNYIGDLKLEQWRFQLNDKIKIETLSITEETYQFYWEMWVQINNANQGLFANPVANVRTNIININPLSKKPAVGHFYGAGLSYKEDKFLNPNTVIK